jgi:hypothetical protein
LAAWSRLSWLPALIRAGREAKGLTWYAVARRAAIPNAHTAGDIEYGRDGHRSNVDGAAEALGVRLEKVEAKRLSMAGTRR